MPLIELYCKKCNKTSEELVNTSGDYPTCKICGTKLQQNYSGKLFVNSAKIGSCAGNCGGCKGCKK